MNPTPNNWPPRRLRVLVACEFSGIVREAIVLAIREQAV